LWLHGPQRGTADVQVVWRADLGEEVLQQSIDGVEAAEDIAIEMVESIPPVSAEAMSVPFIAAKRWLEGRSEPDSFDVEGAGEPAEDESGGNAVFSPRAAVAWRGDQSRVIRASQLRPGETIV